MRNQEGTGHLYVNYNITQSYTYKLANNFWYLFKSLLVVQTISVQTFPPINSISRRCIYVVFEDGFLAPTVGSTNFYEALSLIFAIFSDTVVIQKYLCVKILKNNKNIELS